MFLGDAYVEQFSLGNNNRSIGARLGGDGLDQQHRLFDSVLGLEISASLGWRPQRLLKSVSRI